VSSDDDILDLVKELDKYLDSYVPVEVTDSFIDHVLEETGNSTGDIIMPAQLQRQQRRRRSFYIAYVKASYVTSLVQGTRVDSSQEHTSFD